jgi:3-methylcrotonyl-CoA carboxylase beta subunit
MGGEQAAGVLATVKRDGLERQGKEWSAEDEAAFKQPILDKYEKESSCFYSSARVWDDGVIEPRDTRDVLGMALATVTEGKPIPDTSFGVFRM